MNSRLTLNRLQCGFVRTARKVGCTGLGCLLVVGCAPDHRITLEQFLTRTAQHIDIQPPEEERPATPVNIDRVLGSYRVGQADVLNVVLSGADQAGLLPPFQARVDRNGQIDIPIAGAVNVLDMELEDVEDAIRTAYVPAVFSEVVVHVELTSVDTTSVLVVGAVSDPGLIPLRRTERNLLHAIAAAGGMSEQACGSATLRSLRRLDSEVTLNLRDPAELQKALAMDPLEAGDIITVHAAQPNVVYVGGLVLRAGPQPYLPGTEVTVLQALAAAGGLRTDIFPTEGTLVRRRPDGTDDFVKLDLDRLALGQDLNIALAPGDILWVPDTWQTRVQDFVNRNFFLRAGISVNYNVTGIEYLNRHSQQSRGNSGGGLQDAFDPLGFLAQNAALQGIQGTLATQPTP